MANTHRLYFLRYLTMNDWNDLYHSSNSFLYSLKNSYIKNLKKPNNIKSKHLILYETLISNQILLNKDLDELELLLQSEVAKTYTITKNAFDKDLSRFLKNVDDFLAEKKLIYYSSEYEKQVALLHFFLQEKEDVQVDKKLVDIEKALTSNSKKLDSNNSFEKYKFYNKKAGILKYRKIEDFPLYIDKAFNSLNNFYISNVYKNACASIITNLNYKTNFKPKELPIFPQKIITDEICLGYYNAYEILLKIYNNKQEFIKLETIQKLLHPILYFESRKIYSIEDVKTLYMIKLNLSISL